MGVEVVHHLAAAHLGASVTDAEFERVNVGAVRSLVGTAIDAGVQRFVHCSSVGVFGRIDNPPADEDSPCHPDIAYERSKLAGEQAVIEAVTTGFPAVIIRPVWVYGPGDARTEKLFAYEAFLKEHLTRVPGVSGIKSSFALNQVKYRTALPLPPADTG